VAQVVVPPRRVAAKAQPEREPGLIAVANFPIERALLLLDVMTTLLEK
jgi:hypothetical protein